MQSLKTTVIALILLGGISAVWARTYYLPDYQKEFYSGNRTQSDDSGRHTSTPSCSDYGLASAPQTNADCTARRPAPGLSCYSCSCNPKYKYSQTSSPYCLDPKILAGESCGGKWTQCLCPSSLFPYTEENCVFPLVGGNLYGGSCADDQGMHYSACSPACGELEAAKGRSCPAGGGYEEGSCKEYWGGECPYTCKVGFTDCCHAREDNETDYGCEKYWRDCPTKCEVGKTCAPQDCSSYLLGTVPANASYETCTPGCGDNTPKYKLISCNDGYYLSGQGCLPKSCPAGSALNLAGCGEETFEYGWELGAQVAQSGAQPCYQCEMICLEYGYELNSNKTECVVRPCPSGYAVNQQQCGSTMRYGVYSLNREDYDGWSDNERCYRCDVSCGSDGTYKYKKTAAECGAVTNGSYSLEETGEPCKRCVLKCNAGYADSTSACGTKPEHGYWSLSGSGSCRKCTLKCDSGYSASNGKCVQTCTPNDCSNYKIEKNQLDEETTVYASCTPGCGDDTPRYMIRSCRSGYNLEGSKCVPTDVCAKAALESGFKQEYAEKMSSGSCNSYTNTYPLCFTITSGMTTTHCGWTFPDNRTEANCVGMEREVKISSVSARNANKNPAWVLKNIYQGAFSGSTPGSGATIRRIQDMSGYIRFCVTQ